MATSSNLRRVLAPLRSFGLALLPGLLPGLLVGCTNGQLDQQHYGVAVGLIESVASAPGTVAHEGIRLVEIFGENPADGVYLAHRELIQVDGKGGFSLQPIEALATGDLDDTGYLWRQIAQAGFNYRYRDFRILSAEAFLQNYELTSYGVMTTVAGRPCQQIQVQRRVIQGDPPTRKYVLDLDTETTLALSVQELSIDGQPLSKVVYESFKKGLPASMVPDTIDNAEVSFPLGEALVLALGFKFQTPTFVPAGFQFLGASKVVDQKGQTWVKLVYTDGVEKAFLCLCSAPAPMPNKRGVIDPSSLGAVLTPDGLQPGHIGFLTIGSLNCVQGWIYDWKVTAIGRLPLIDLHAMVESAVPPQK